MAWDLQYIWARQLRKNFPKQCCITCKCLEVLEIYVETENEFYVLAGVIFVSNTFEQNINLAYNLV